MNELMTMKLGSNGPPPPCLLPLDGSEAGDEEDHESLLMMDDDDEQEEALSFETSPPLELDLEAAVRPDDDFGKVVVVVPSKTLQNETNAKKKEPKLLDNDSLTYGKGTEVLLNDEMMSGPKDEILSEATTVSVTSNEDNPQLELTKAEKQEESSFIESKAEYFEERNVLDGTNKSKEVNEEDEELPTLPDKQGSDVVAPDEINKEDDTSSRVTNDVSVKQDLVGSSSHPSQGKMLKESKPQLLQDHCKSQGFYVQPDEKEGCMTTMLERADETGVALDEEIQSMMDNKATIENVSIEATQESTQKEQIPSLLVEDFTPQYVQLSMPRSSSWSLFRMGQPTSHRLISLPRLFARETSEDDDNVDPFAKLSTLALKAYAGNHGDNSQLTFHFTHKGHEFVLLSTDDLLDALRVSKDDTLVIQVRPAPTAAIPSSLVSNALVSGLCLSSPSPSSWAYMALVSMYVVVPIVYMGHMVTSFHRDKLLYTTESWIR